MARGRFHERLEYGWIAPLRKGLVPLDPLTSTPPVTVLMRRVETLIAPQPDRTSASCVSEFSAIAARDSVRIDGVQQTARHVGNLPIHEGHVLAL